MASSGRTFRIDAIGRLMAQDDLVVTLLHFRAEWPGASISMSGVDVLRIADGRIPEVWLFSEDQAAEDAFWGWRLGDDQSLLIVFASGDQVPAAYYFEEQPVRDHYSTATRWIYRGRVAAEPVWLGWVMSCLPGR